MPYMLLHIGTSSRSAIQRVNLLLYTPSKEKHTAEEHIADDISLTSPRAGCPFCQLEAFSCSIWTSRRPRNFPQRRNIPRSYRCFLGVR